MNVDGKTSIRHYKIYVLYNDVTEDTYIDSTCLTLSERLGSHRSLSNKSNSKLYTKMREIDAQNFKIVELLSTHTDWIDAHKTECEFIEFFKPTLNTNVTGKYMKLDGSFDVKAYQKVHCVDHRESRNKRSKEYYIKNKHKILEKVTCDCRVTVSNNNIKRHLGTKKHK